jgi:hypothetical protein
MGNTLFFDLPGKGTSTSISDFVNIIEEDAMEFVNINAQDLDKKLKPIELETVEYLKSLMLAAAEGKKRENIWKETWKGLFETGGFNRTIKEGDSGEFGTFAQNLLGLPSLFPGQKGNEAYPDIPGIGKEAFDVAGIELKTRYRHLGANFSITVGQITAEGINVEGNPLTDSEMVDINSQYNDSKILEAVALNRLMDKMRNFLYMRVLSRDKQKEFYKPVDWSSPGRLKVKARRFASGRGPEIEVMAFILFTRLIIEKVRELVKRTGNAEFRVNVKASPKRVGNIIKSVTYTVELVRDTLGEFDDNGRPKYTSPVDKLIKELNYIRELYAAEYDFINQLEAENWRSARKFYWTIKNNVMRNILFEKLD